MFVYNAIYTIWYNIYCLSSPKWGLAISFSAGSCKGSLMWLHVIIKARCEQGHRQKTPVPHSSFFTDDCILGVQSVQPLKFADNTAKTCWSCIQTGDRTAGILVLSQPGAELTGTSGGAPSIKKSVTCLVPWLFQAKYVKYLLVLTLSNVYFSNIKLFI